MRSADRQKTVFQWWSLQVLQAKIDLQCVFLQEDEYDEDDDESNSISDYSDNDGTDTANIGDNANIGDTANIVDTNASPDDDDDDDEENSFTPRRGRAGYNLRPRPNKNRESESSEQGSDETSEDDEKDEDYTPSFLNEERSRRSPLDEMVSFIVDSLS